MRSIWICSIIATVVTIGAGTPISLKSERTPDVAYYLSSLPGRSFEEIVTTTSAQDIDVTIVRIPDDDVATSNVSGYPTPQETIDPRGTTVFNATNHYQPLPDRELIHRIVLPPLQPGLYEIRLTGRKASAIQRFAVGTLGFIADFEPQGSVILPVDTRTMLRRSDVVVRAFGKAGAQEFSPAQDGLVHIPNKAFESTTIGPAMGKLVLTSSDGSVLALRGLWGYTQRPPSYVETDRNVYRPGDIVHYQVIARRPLPEISYFGLVGPQNVIVMPQRVRMNPTITTGVFVLASDAPPGYYHFAVGAGGTSFFVADTSVSRYEIDVRALAASVPAGEPARFIISARLHNGQPAAGVLIRYAWHFSAAAKELPLEQRVRSSSDLATAAAITDADGNALVTIPTRNVATPAPIELFVYDPDDDHALVSIRAMIAPLSGGAADRGLSISTKGGIAERNRLITVDATSDSDGDALARYGPYDELSWAVVRMENRRATFSVRPRSDEDHLPVTLIQPNKTDVIEANANVRLNPQTRRLNVTISCARQTYMRAEPLRLCIQVHDWQAHSVVAHLNVSVTSVTLAAIVGAQAAGDTLYNMLYDSNGAVGVTENSMRIWPAVAPISYLDKTPADGRLAVGCLGSDQRATAEPQHSPSASEPQTVQWIENLETAANGTATLRLQWPRRAASSFYLIHVTAMSSNRAVGEKYAWFRYAKI